MIYHEILLVNTPKMQRIKIGIVEDEVIIADNIAAILQELGYEVCEPCGSYDEALHMLASEAPDLVLLDINLGRSRSGIEIAEYIRSYNDIPFIFLTANSDRVTLDKAKLAKPNGYLVKPFQKADLYVAIELAIFNFNQANAGQNTVMNVSSPPDETNKDYIFIKDGQYLHKVKFDDILYLSSDHVYITVHTTARKYLVRTSMQEYLPKLNSSFLRIHRSYVVNIDKVDKINSVYLVVNGEQLPVSKNHRENLLGLLQTC